MTTRDAAFVDAWAAALDAHGIVCDDARRQRMTVAAPHLERMRARVRAWRAIGLEVDERFDTERHRER